MRRADGVDGGEGLCECLVFVAARRQFCWHGGAVQGGEECAGLSQLGGVGCGEGFACEPGGLDVLLCAVAGGERCAAASRADVDGAQGGGVVGGGGVAQELVVVAGDEAAFGFVAQDGGACGQGDAQAAVVFGAGEEEVCRGQGEALAAVAFVEAGALPLPVVAGGRQGFGPEGLCVAAVVVKAQRGEAVGLRFVAQVGDAGDAVSGQVRGEGGAEGAVVQQQGEAGECGVAGDEGLVGGAHGLVCGLLGWMLLGFVATQLFIFAALTPTPLSLREQCLSQRERGLFIEL